MQIEERRLELLAVEQADARDVPFHQAGARKHEGACAHTHQWNARPRRPLQECLGSGNQPLATVQQPADDHDVVVGLRRLQRAGGHHRQPATGGDRHAGLAQDRPGAADRATAIAFIGGQSEHIDEARERAEREALGQHEADLQPPAAVGADAGRRGLRMSHYNL